MVWELIFMRLLHIFLKGVAIQLCFSSFIPWSDTRREFPWGKFGYTWPPRLESISRAPLLVSPLSPLDGAKSPVTEPPSLSCLHALRTLIKLLPPVL